MSSEEVRADNEELIAVISRIVINGSAAHERRRSDIIRSVKLLTEYIHDEASDAIIKKSSEWKSVHVRQSQYFLQIVKCDDTNCCKPFRSSYLSIIKEIFLPVSVAVTRNNNDLEWVKSKAYSTQAMPTRQLESKTGVETVLPYI